jgi:ribosomal protein L32E
MRRVLSGLVLVVLVVVLAAPLAAQQPAELVVGGYKLPRDHRYESPDAAGKYEVVDVKDVPGLIQKGRFIFDRTANVWVKNPNGTVNKQYLAPTQASEPLVIGGYKLPRDHRYESPDAADKYEVVDVKDVPGMIQKGKFIFDRTSNVWVKHPNGTVNKQYLAAGPAAAADALVIGGYKLPRDHRYESPDAAGKYEVVDVKDVPGLIQKGKFIFDRTANVWVKNPNGTVNKQYLAQ